MRKDLDRLMAERNIDAFIIPANEGENAYRDYITGGVHAHAIVVKKRDEDAVIIANHMETEEAAKSGLPVMSYDDFDLHGIIQKHGRGTTEATIAFWNNVFQTLDIQGRVTLYGLSDMQAAMRLIKAIQKTDSELIQDHSPDIFSVAYQTKDPDELDKLRESGRRASAAMRDVREWLMAHRAVDGQVVNGNNEPLTIGAVKRKVRLILLGYDMEDNSGMIFAQGRDGGVPHNRGEADDVLRAGEAIVFDLFPRPIGGGYYHDMTRTWSLGFARDEVKADYDLVMNVFTRSLEEITLGEPTNKVAKAVCEWFEGAGHLSRLNTPSTTDGYVHSLGHGLGLNVHESPGVSHLSSDKTVFEAGNVVTIEPGLYYPNKGYGIRIEDTVILHEDGSLENITDCPYDLVVPLNG